MMKSMPADMDSVRKAAEHAIAPLKPARWTTQPNPDESQFGSRTNAGRNLPPYYLVRFLLIDLLGYDHLGRYEKEAWSVPVDYGGMGLVIAHRKMGLGVFARNPGIAEDTAQKVVICIEKAVRAAQPYFDWLAQDAIAKSTVNVVNISSDLYDRFTFLLNTYHTKKTDAEHHRTERIILAKSAAGDGRPHFRASPYPKLCIEAEWLAISAIEAFFSWTEHVLIHLAIISGRVVKAKDVAALAQNDWADKFKHSIDVSQPKTKDLFDRLVALRRDVRNYVAHGAFGKQGEAFFFHSNAGAVPVLLPHLSSKRKYRLGPGLRINVAEALRTVADFNDHLWSDERAPAKIYIQESGLPLILTMASDGTYERAMKSVAEMKQLVTKLFRIEDDANNMDW